MVSARNHTKQDSPSWIRLWVIVGMFVGVTGFVFDMMQSCGNAQATATVATLAPAYTAVIFAAFFLLRSLFLRQSMKTMALIFVAVCAFSGTLIYTIQTQPTQSHGVAQAQSSM